VVNEPSVGANGMRIMECNLLSSGGLEASWARRVYQITMGTAVVKVSSCVTTYYAVNL
jgi:hypothetical protein